MAEITLTEAESRGIQVVDHHLQVIEDTWTPGVQTSAIYQHAAVLRLLLGDGGLSTAWRKVWPAGQRSALTVVAPDLRWIIPDNLLPYVVHAQSTGFAKPGKHMFMPVALREGASIAANVPAGTASHVTERDPAIQSVEYGLRGGILSGLIDQSKVPLAPASCYRRYRLTQFMAAGCMIVDGAWISRTKLVNDFVNQFGGAHLAWNDEELRYRNLTESARWLRIRGRSPAAFELLSIGQVVVKSESVQLFRERVRRLRLEPLL
jgi:hypothetical protein